MRLKIQKDFEEFSNQLAMAGIELPENLIIHLTSQENKEWLKEINPFYLSKRNINLDNIKITTVQTQFHKLKIQVD